MRLIAFGGLKGSGKDAAADPLRAMGWTALKFADPLWACLEALDLHVMHLGCYVRLNPLIHGLGREEVKKQVPAVRGHLERIGTEMGRNVLGQDIWVEHMLRRLVVQSADDASVVITDVRFANEADLVHRLGGVVVVIRRPGVPQGSHSSELLNFQYDEEIWNDGSLDELHFQVRELVRAL